MSVSRCKQDAQNLVHKAQVSRKHVQAARQTLFLANSSQSHPCLFPLLTFYARLSRKPHPIRPPPAQVSLCPPLLRDLHGTLHRLMPFLARLAPKIFNSVHGKNELIKKTQTALVFLPRLCLVPALVFFFARVLKYISISRTSHVPPMHAGCTVHNVA